MEQRLANLLLERLLDPVVLITATAVTGALLSGLAARVAEIWEDWAPLTPAGNAHSGSRLPRPLLRNVNHVHVPMDDNVECARDGHTERRHRRSHGARTLCRQGGEAPRAQLTPALLRNLRSRERGVPAFAHPAHADPSRSVDLITVSHRDGGNARQHHRGHPLDRG
jgi:hypothetical protein